MSSNNSQSSRVSDLLERLGSRRPSATTLLTQDEITDDEGYSEELFEMEYEDQESSAAAWDNSTKNRENEVNSSNVRVGPSSGTEGPRKTSFSTIKTASMAPGLGEGNLSQPQPEAKLSQAEELTIKLEATNSQNEKLRDSLESAHRQIEELRNAQAKSKIRTERQVRRTEL